MKQNIYDNQEFFRGYKELREMKAGLNEALEHPALFSLFPDVQEAFHLMNTARFHLKPACAYTLPVANCISIEN